MADNNLNNPEVILSINFDGIHSKTWGRTIFLVHAPIGGMMNPKDFGVNDAWNRSDQIWQIYIFILFMALERGVKDGKGLEDFRNLYPIPINDLIANRNLIQNPGY